MVTFLNSGMQPLQQTSLPQGAIPPKIFVSSRIPTCLNSILIWKVAAKSLTSSRKSTLPSDVKFITTFDWSRLSSALVTFKSSPSSSLNFSAVCLISFSFEMDENFRLHQKSCLLQNL